MVSDRVPRRNTTLVLDTPHARPIASNTTTGFDTSSVTPRSPGPGHRSKSPHVSPCQRSMRSESAAMTARARVPCMTAAFWATANAVVTSWAAVLTAIQSRRAAMRGIVTAITMATIATITMSSASVMPRRMGLQ